MLGRKIVLFDSECATCHGLVRFLIARRRRDQFVFIPIQALIRSPWASTLDVRGRPLGGDSIVVISQGRALQRSAAVFAVFQTLGWPWRLLNILKIIPQPIADFIYDLYARNRYRILGRADPQAFCELPDPEVGRLFLAEIPDDCLPTSAQI